nr:acyltransferase [Butyrivibrio sp. WCE2006]
MYERDIRKKLKRLVDCGYTKFVIIPYGTVGLLVEDVLHRVFGIDPVYIVDNEVCKYNAKVISIEQFQRCDTDAAILVTTEKYEVEKEIKTALCTFIKGDRVFSLMDLLTESNSQDHNSILGDPSKIINSSINFVGRNNILYCEPGVVLENATLNFNGDNSLVYLGKSRGSYKLKVELYNDCVFKIGADSSIHNQMVVILSEQRHCIIGKDNMISWGVMIRDSDPHLLYDTESKRRINLSKSVYIGDHVWIGQNSLILKGTQIDSGSVIGASSVVASRHVTSNTVWAGNPARKIRENILWDRPSVHLWKEEMTDASLSFDNYLQYIGAEKKNADDFVYKYNEDESLDYDEIDKKLNECTSAEKRLGFLIDLESGIKKNRFAHKYI